MNVDKTAGHAANLAIVLGLGVFLLYAGLTPLGPWLDEYFTLQALRQRGLDAMLDRLTHWSPRPLSESLIYGYSLLVQHVGRPMVGTFVAPFWLFLLAVVLLPTWRSKPALLSAAVLLAMLLMGHTVAEVFYWPVGMAAYLPTAAAAACILALDWGGWLERRTGRAWLVAALLVAATSSEVGAMFAACYALFAIAAEWGRSPRYILLMMLPLLVSVGILYAQFEGRVAKNAEILGDPAIAHHPARVLASLKATLFFDLIKGGDVQHARRALLGGLATKLACFVGFYLALSARRDKLELSRSLQGMRLALGAAAPATAVLTLAASYYNFGSSCCERHDTMRQIYVFITIGALASYAAARWPAKHTRLAGVVLLLALLIPLHTSMLKLDHDYRNYAFFQRARHATWVSGHTPGTVVRVAQVPPGLVVGGQLIAPGTYHRSDSIKNLVDWVMVYYDKQTAVVEAPIGAP